MTVLNDLPEWLFVDEILVRLPVKDVLSCRAVCKSWRSGTSTDAFILGHHHRQLSLPIYVHQDAYWCVVRDRDSNDLKARPVLWLRHSSDIIFIRATCQGLLILSWKSDFYICNPAIRKCASLLPPAIQPHIRAVTVAGFYRHHTSGEHRVLWVSYPVDAAQRSDVAVELLEYLVLTVGSDQPRCIQCRPTASEQRFISPIEYYSRSVHHRGSLHWAMGLKITVFDTIAETFRQMSRPTQLGDMVSLMDMGGALALCRIDPNRVTLDVWVLQDYDAEMWGFQYQINLSAMQASPPLKYIGKFTPIVAVINERELLIEPYNPRLLHCDIDGVFLGNVEIKEHGNFLILTRHRLQESMISLSLFETEEDDDVSKEPPFAIVL